MYSFIFPVLYRIVCTVPYGEKWYVKDFVMYERNQNHQSWKWLCYRKNEPGGFPFIGFIWEVSFFFYIVWHMVLIHVIQGVSTILWGCLEVTGWLKIKKFNSSRTFMQIPLKVNKVYFFDIKHGLTMTFWFFFFFKK